MEKKKRWSVRECIIESKKYDCASDFRLGNNDAYQASKKFGILNNLYSKTGNLCGNSQIWTAERITEEVKKYKTRTEFRLGNGSAYYASKRLGLLDQLMPMEEKSETPKVEKVEKPKKKISRTKLVARAKKYNNLGKLKKIAKKYATRSDFFFGDNGAYNACRRFGLLDELFPESVHSEYTSWNDEKLKSEAEKYDNRNSFRLGCYNGYFAAYRRNTLKQISPNLKTKRHTSNNEN